MTDVKDLMFNYYEYIKSIYVYSHLKTNLVDKYKQTTEMVALYLLIIITSLIFFFAMFKILVIVIYFICVQANTAFFHFLKLVYVTKMQINFKASFKNAMSYLSKVCKRLYTFNFYIYQKIFIGIINMISFIMFLISSFCFEILNLRYISKENKADYYLWFFFLSYEFTLLTELLCTTFYSCRNMIMSTFLALGYFILINFILFIGYQIKELNEDMHGAYETEEPQKIMNIVLNVILLMLNFINLVKIIRYNKNGKYKIYLYNI